MTEIDIHTFGRHANAGHASSFGAHVLDWQPNSDHPLLWLSPRAVTDGTAPIRGGIPVCAPWFAAPDQSPAMPPPGAPAHGLARTRRWELEERAPQSLTYSFTHRRADDDGVFPHDFTARVVIQGSEELTVALALVNDDDHPFAVEAALHAYLAVGDVKDITIDGLDGAPYYDAAKGRNAVQKGALSLVGPTDRIYVSTSPIHVMDPRWGRRITVDKSGSGTTVVWNPWREGAARIADMGDDDWQRFVCVETANARQRAITLWPGHPRRLTATYGVDQMD